MGGHFVQLYLVLWASNEPREIQERGSVKKETIVKVP